MEKKLTVKFIVSEDIEGQAIGNNMSRNIIINPILVMRSPYIPTVLSLAISIIAFGIDFTKNHTFRMVLTNIEQGTGIYDSGENFYHANQTQYVDNFSFNFQLRNIPFEKEGDYKVTLYFDQEDYHDTFKVLKVGN